LKHFLKNHLPWIVWGFFIVALVSIPGKELPVLSESVDRFQPDKLIHVFLFLIFVILLIKGFYHPAADPGSQEKTFFISLLAAIILGGGTEIFQHFCIPGRNASLKDFLFNTLGCVVGWFICSLWTKRIHHR
jgi:VanZ family protein